MWRTETVLFRDVIALAAAITLVGASFGALALTAGLSLWLAMAMSLLVFAGGSQLLAQRLTVPQQAQRLLGLAATALLAALVATAALTDGSGFAGWARATGVAVGAVAAWLRTPFVVVVLLAAGTTAVLRALGVP